MIAIDFPVFVEIWNHAVQGQTTPQHHNRVAGWLQQRWRAGDRQLLLMAFRSSGKSTLVGLFAAWLLSRDPDLRILVLAADLALARKMVRNAKRIIERHPATRGLKPPRADQWAAEQFTVARPAELRDPSMLARGITANLTGSRADFVICDDVEVPNTCDTALKRADLRARLAEIDYVLTPAGTQLYVGTPHTYYTIYALEPRPEIGEAAPFLDGFRRLEIPLLGADGALTGLHPADLTDPALPSHPDAIRTIAERLQAWSPAIFLGWNSLHFDETVLRQALFQTLHPAAVVLALEGRRQRRLQAGAVAAFQPHPPPFLTTSDGNGRGDVMRMVRAASIYAPQSLFIPLDDRGRPSFRLDRVAPANECGPGNAHDAVADAEATLAIARRLHANARAFWDAALRLTRPEAVRVTLRDSLSVALTDFVFDQTRNRLVTYCGTNPKYSGEMAAFDLAIRPDDILRLPTDDLVGVLGRRRAIVPIRATRQPLLMPAGAAPADTEALRVSPGRLEERARRVRSDLGFHHRVAEAMVRRPRRYDPDRPVEAKLYDARIAPEDLDRLAAFHAAPWVERPAWLEMIGDSRLREIGGRLLWLERPDLLTCRECALWSRWTARRVLSEDPDVPWRTAAAALREAENMIACAAEPERVFFAEAQAFIATMGDRWAQTV